MICEDSGEECLDEYVYNMTYTLVEMTTDDGTVYYEVYGSGKVIN